MSPGQLIVFEGGDGSGKSTQVELLVAALRQRGWNDLTVTREPGGTAFGQHIRAALLHGEEVTPRAEALAYAADRADHVASVIRPALDRGGIVISDRYLDSSIAYQVEARGLAETDVRSINQFATGGLQPDLTILLDLDPTAAAARRAGDPDRIEQAGIDFHRKVAARYRELAAANPSGYIVLDATDSIGRIHQKALAAVMSVVGTRLVR